MIRDLYHDLHGIRCLLEVNWVEMRICLNLIVAFQNLNLVVVVVEIAVDLKVMMNGLMIGFEIAGDDDDVDCDVTVSVMKVKVERMNLSMNCSSVFVIALNHVQFYGEIVVPF